MKKLITVLVAPGFLMVMTIPVSAAYDKDDIAEIVEKVKKGEAIYKRDTLPFAQIIGFLSGSINYSIDITAQLCFESGRKEPKIDFTLVPCEALKKGYPLIAPLITWEK